MRTALIAKFKRQYAEASNVIRTAISTLEGIKLETGQSICDGAWRMTDQPEQGNLARRLSDHCKTDTLSTIKDIYSHPMSRYIAETVFDDNNNWGVSADINLECAYMGNGIYEALAQIIHPSRPIYDFGASYGLQSWLFRHHKRYIAIQPEHHGKRPSATRFRTDNSIWFCGTIAEFFDQFTVEHNSFAICNAVPSAEVRLVKEQCLHVYVDYPCVG